MMQRKSAAPNRAGRIPDECNLSIARHDRSAPASLALADGLRIPWFEASGWRTEQAGLGRCVTAKGIFSDLTPLLLP